jgi:D-sedoheptulose 7-phosphate isomerase
MLTGDFRNLVYSLPKIVEMSHAARDAGQTVVLTNGCFDLLHPGHFNYLYQSSQLGDKFLVAVNSDASVRALKGEGRPVNHERHRAEAIAALRFVDGVFVFPGMRLTEEIRAIRPNVYTKAGDYTLDTLDPGERGALESSGTEIRFMPFLDGHSTSSLISNPLTREQVSRNPLSFGSTLDHLRGVLHDSRILSSAVEIAAQEIVECVKAGSKILTCGNGGSAADALHLAEELVGRYRQNRKALPAICLCADPTALTCIANDYGYGQVFSRGVEAFGKPGDIFVGFTTSGNSQNVIEAIRSANALGLVTILVSGNTGGNAKSMCKHEIIVPCNDTARIQEVHTVVLHQWLEYIENEFAAQ